MSMGQYKGHPKVDWRINRNYYNWQLFYHLECNTPTWAEECCVRPCHLANLKIDIICCSFLLHQPRRFIIIWIRLVSILSLANPHCDLRDILLHVLRTGFQEDLCLNFLGMRGWPSGPVNSYGLRFLEWILTWSYSTTSSSSPVWICLQAQRPGKRQRQRKCWVPQS